MTKPLSIRRWLSIPLVTLTLVACGGMNTTPTPLLPSPPSTVPTAILSCSAMNASLTHSSNATTYAPVATCRLTTGTSYMHATATSSVSWMTISFGGGINTPTDIIAPNSTATFQLIANSNVPVGTNTAIITITSPEYQTLLINFTLTVTNG